MITTMKITKSEPEMKYISIHLGTCTYGTQNSHSDNYQHFTCLHEIASIIIM